MIKLNGYFIAISVLVVLVSSETFDNRTTPHNERIPTQPPNPLPQEGTTTTVRFLNQGTPGAPTTRPPPATTTQPVGRGPTPVRSTQVSPARQNQTPARATSSSSRPPTPTAKSPSPARQGQTPAGPSTSRPPTPTRSSSMRPTPTGSGTTSSRRTTPGNVVEYTTSASSSRGTRTTPTAGSPGTRTTPTPTLSSSVSPTNTLSFSTPSSTTIFTPEFTTPPQTPVVSSGASPELSSGGVTTGGVTSSLASTPGVSTGGVSTETAGVSTTTVGSSSMSSSSPSTSPVVSTSLSTESSSGSPSSTSPASSSISSGSTTVESTTSSSVSTSVTTGSSSSASSSSASSSASSSPSSASTSSSTSASTSPTSTASSTSTSVSSPSSPTSTASSTTTTITTTITSTPSSTTLSTTPTSTSTTPSSTTPPISTPPPNGGGQLIHTQIMFCNKYGSYYLPQDPISYNDYISYLKMAISSTCGVGPDRIQGLELVKDPPSGNTLIQFDVLPGPGLSTDALVLKIQDQVSTGQFKVTDKNGNVFSVQCSLPIYPMCPWTDYGPCPREVCQHGGICRVAVSCQYFCECPSGWFGQFCEKGAEPAKKKDNLWLLWLLIVPLVLLGLLALLCCFCCWHRCCWGAAAGPRKVQIIEEDIYQDVPACSEHGTVRSCRSMHSARPSSIYAINPPQMASDAGSTYYHALGRPFAVAFSDNTFSAIGYATNDMGIYNTSGRKMLPAASCCGDDEIEVIMNNPGRRGSCCGSMISETGSGYHSALGNRYAVAYNDRAFNTYSSMPRMGSIRHYN